MAERNNVASAKRAAAVTPSDTTLLEATRAVWVGGAGNLAVLMTDDYDQAAMPVAVTLTGVPAGTLLPISVRKIMSTNTTATSITALW